MKRIAILSDTHGLLRPEVLARLDGADAILHAGDINTPAILDALRARGALYVVRGNNDKDWAEDLPHSLTVSIEGVRFFMVHNKKDVPGGLTGVDAVVYGHSHQYACEEREGVLWLNPGSCGRRRFDREITFALMEVEAGQYRVEKITIPQERK
jgi:hypothetical protein